MLLLLLVVIVALVVAFGVWAKRRGRSAGAEDWRRAPLEEEEKVREKAMRAPGGMAPPGFGSLAADLARWVSAGILSAEQADAIAAFERREAGAPRRVSLLAEALGYTGAVLAVAGGAVGLGQAWDGMEVWARLAAAGGITALLAVGGWLLRESTEPAFRRFMSVLWLLTVGGVAWLLAVLSIEVIELADERTVLLVGGGMSLVAGVLYAYRRLVLQQAALVASLHVALIGALLLLPETRPLWAFALGVWGLGVLWAALGWLRVMTPGWAALAFGTLGALVGPSIGLGEHQWLLAPALGTAVALVVASVPTRQVPLLAVGSLGTFAYVTWAVVHYFRDTLGVPLALAVVGLVFLALAVLAGRLGLLTRSRRGGTSR